MARKAGWGCGKSMGLAVQAAHSPSQEVSHFPLPAPAWPSVTKSDSVTSQADQVPSFTTEPAHSRCSGKACCIGVAESRPVPWKQRLEIWAPGSEAKLGV